MLKGHYPWHHCRVHLMVTLACTFSALERARALHTLCKTVSLFHSCLLLWAPVWPAITQSLSVQRVTFVSWAMLRITTTFSTPSGQHVRQGILVKAGVDWKPEPCMLIGGISDLTYTWLDAVLSLSVERV